MAQSPYLKTGDLLLWVLQISIICTSINKIPRADEIMQRTPMRKSRVQVSRIAHWRGRIRHRRNVRGGTAKATTQPACSTRWMQRWRPLDRCLQESPSVVHQAEHGIQYMALVNWSRGRGGGRQGWYQILGKMPSVPVATGGNAILKVLVVPPCRICR